MKQAVFFTLIILLIPFIFNNSLAQQINNIQRNPNLFYIQAIPTFSLAEIQIPNESTRLRINEFVKQQLKLSFVGMIDSSLDIIIILTDDSGNPILPDAERYQKYPSLRKSLSELTFTFNSTAYPWTQVEIDSMNNRLEIFYTKAKSIYGNPAFAISVNIRKDPNITAAALYSASNNEIVLKNLNSPDQLCHEMIHAFRDDYMISYRTYEEGMTRAAEVEIFNQLDNYQHWDENHSYGYDVFYDEFNKPNIGAKNGNIYSNPTLQLTKYQISSYVWAKFYLEDKDFLKDFNSLYYSQMDSDPSVRNTESKLKNIVETIKPTIENQPTDLWYSKQYILDSNPSTGYKIFQRICQFTVDYFIWS